MEVSSLTIIYQLLEPLNILALFLGSAGGILVGAHPDLTPTMGVALLLPFSFAFPPETTLILLVGIYCGSMFGGSISAILTNVPGSPAASMTSLDGYKLAQQGRSGYALFTAGLASMFGGVVGFICFYFVTPYVARVGWHIKGADAFWLLVFALVAIASLSSRRFLKGILSGLLGLCFAVVGQDPVTGDLRLTMGLKELENGFPLAVLVVGIFTLAPVLRLAENKLHRTGQPYELHRPYFLPFWQVAGLTVTSIYASFIGNLVGLLPGAGASVGSRLAYRLTRGYSDQKKLFGRGSLDGVAAAEAGNSAATGGALVPSLGLGIPGDSVTAILLCGLAMLGLRPGLSLFKENLQMTHTVMWGFLLVQILIFVMGMVLAKIFAQFARIPERMMIPLLVVLSVVGIYGLRRSFFDVFLLLPLSLIGYFFRKFDLNPTALLTGVLLGRDGEFALRMTLQSEGGNLRSLFTSPLALIFILLAVAAFVLPIFFDRFRKQLWEQSSGIKTSPVE